MNYSIILSTGAVYVATLNDAQFDNFKRVLRSGSNDLFHLPGTSTYIVPSKVVSIEGGIKND